MVSVLFSAVAAVLISVRFREGGRGKRRKRKGGEKREGGRGKGRGKGKRKEEEEREREGGRQERRGKGKARLGLPEAGGWVEVWDCSRAQTDPCPGGWEEQDSGTPGRVKTSQMTETLRRAGYAGACPAGV